MGDGEPFPVALELTPIARLAKGRYKAVEIGAVVTVTATDIRMSGLGARAELIQVPNFAPPIRYRLTVWETLPQLANLIIGTASAFITSWADERAGLVQIEDADGLHDVTIEKEIRPTSIASAATTAGPVYRGQGRTLDEAVQNASKKAPHPAGFDMISTLTVFEWGFTSGGYVGFSDYWVKCRIE